MVPLADRLAPLERRLRLVEAARAAIRGAIAGAVLGAGWFGVAWALRIPWAVPTALGALAAAAGTAFVIRALKPIPLNVVARAADRAAGTEDRFSTALELNSSDWGALVARDAGAIPLGAPSRLFRLPPVRSWRLPGAAAGLVAALAFLPARPPPPVPPTESIRDLQLPEELARAAEDVRRAGAETADPVLTALGTELGEIDRAWKEGRIEKKEALARIGEVKSKAKAARERATANREALARVGEAPAGRELAKKIAEGSGAEAVKEASERVGQNSRADADLADALERASRASGADPELARALESAASAARRGDSEGFEKAMNEAKEKWSGIARAGQKEKREEEARKGTKPGDPQPDRTAGGPGDLQPGEGTKPGDPQPDRMAGGPGDPQPGEGTKPGDPQPDRTAGGPGDPQPGEGTKPGDPQPDRTAGGPGDPQPGEGTKPGDPQPDRTAGGPGDPQPGEGTKAGDPQPDRTAGGPGDPQPGEGTKPGDPQPDRTAGGPGEPDRSPKVAPSIPDQVTQQQLEEALKKLSSEDLQKLAEAGSKADPETLRKAMEKMKDSGSHQNPTDSESIRKLAQDLSEKLDGTSLGEWAKRIGGQPRPATGPDGQDVGRWIRDLGKEQDKPLRDAERAAANAERKLGGGGPEGPPPTGSAEGGQDRLGRDGNRDGGGSKSSLAGTPPATRRPIQFKDARVVVPVGDGSGGEATGEVVVAEPGAPGESKVPFERVLVKYRADAEKALDQESYPEEYRRAVRDYFDSLK